MSSIMVPNAPTALHNGKYWPFLPHDKIQINIIGLKNKIIGTAISGEFSNVGAKFFTHFLIFAPKKAQNIYFLSF